MLIVPASKVSEPFTVVIRMRSKVADKDFIPLTADIYAPGVGHTTTPLADHELVESESRLKVIEPLNVPIAIASVLIVKLVVKRDVPIPVGEKGRFLHHIQ